MQSILPSASLCTTHLRFQVRAITLLQVDAFNGSALRGSLFSSIWLRFCTNRPAPSCAECSLHAVCPVSALVAPLREESARGRDIPRPYVIVPPLEGARRYQPGEGFTFGITLIGNIVQLLPYILLALPQMEAEGLGRPLAENGGQRGRFKVETVESFHPWTGEQQTLYAAGRARANTPTINTTVEEWRTHATTLDQTRITLRLLTPLRLVDHEQVVRDLHFLPLFHRMLERYSALERYYGNVHYTLTKDEEIALLQHAEAITRVSDDTHWQELRSHSNRQGRSTPIGGLLGEVTFAGNLAPFLPLLIAGESLHLGKSVVKGNGKYQIVRSQLSRTESTN